MRTRVQCAKMAGEAGAGSDVQERWDGKPRSNLFYRLEENSLA